MFIVLGVIVYIVMAAIIMYLLTRYLSEEGDKEGAIIFGTMLWPLVPIAYTLKFIGFGLEYIYDTAMEHRKRDKKCKKDKS